jgi:F-type H+-transporting ATPase subunit epsilon
MKLDIITPEQIYFSGEVSSVTLPGKGGFFTIWDNHAPLISSLKEGKLSYTAGGTVSAELTIGGGFVEINNNAVTVCLERVL